MNCEIFFSTKKKKKKKKKFKMSSVAIFTQPAKRYINYPVLLPKLPVSSHLEPKDFFSTKRY